MSSALPHKYVSAELPSHINATLGLALMFVAFPETVRIVITIDSPSRTAHTTDTCGSPDADAVDR